MLRPSQFDPAYERLRDAALYVFAGYGFNDPDLRGLLPRLLVPVNGSRKPSAIWLQRTKPKKADETRGMDVLRAEFMDSTGIILHICDVFDPDRSFFVELARALNLPGSSQITLPGRTDSWKEEVAPTADAGPMRSLSAEAAIEFVARLCYFANTGDAHLVAHHLATCSDDVRRRADRVLLCCASATHTSSHERNIEVCEELRKRHHDPDTAAITCAYESFSHALATADVRRSTRLLRWGKRYTRACTALTRARFNQFYLHHWLKLLQRLYLDLPSTLDMLGGQWCIRIAARRLAQRLRAAAAQAESENDIHFVAQLHDLEAQARILCGDHKTASTPTRRAQEIYGAMGNLNGMALIDRTLGWLHLAQGARSDARRVLARGLYRSLRASDTSLAPKLAVNLTRVLIADGLLSGLRGQDCVDEPSELRASVSDAALRLMDARSSAAMREADGMSIWRFAVARFARVGAAALLDHQLRFSCVEKYPIYHPPKPPQRVVERGSW